MGLIVFADKNNSLENVLEKIERDIFSSLTDPGIHGIVTRLNGLGFLDLSPYTCSGHPSLNPKSTLSLADDGIITIRYDLRNPKAKKFRNELRKIAA